MAFDYSNARATAEKLISIYGAAGQFIKTGSTGGFDDYGNVIADEPDITIDGIVTPLLSFKTNEVDGQNILASDSYCFFHSDTAPEVGYQHTQNGVVYRVVSIMKEITSVGGVNVFRKLQLRR